MLQSFLNRLFQHPILSTDHLFHRFIEAEISWNDVLLAENYKKEKIVFSGGKPKNVDPKFVEFENENLRSSHALSGVDKINKKIGKKYRALAEDLMDFGAAFNGFSLEDNHLSAVLEKFGQALDLCQMSTERNATYFAELFGDALHEYVLFSQSVKTTLKYRAQKQLIYEELSDQLFAKKNQLLQIESKRSKSNFSWMTTSLNNLVDADPEQSRNNAIVKTKDLINQV